MARVYTGTDGIRGRVRLESGGNPLEELLEEQILSRDLVELSAYAFGRLLYDNGLLERGAEVCIAGDGRDVTTGGQLTTALVSGLRKNGFQVADLGTIPTPFLPAFMLSKGIDAGIMLTASHNPADQNGVKFFFQGKKLLPEGIPGERSLSAMMDASLEEYSWKEEGGGYRRIDVNDFCLDWLDSLIPTIDFLRSGKLIVDTANGAYTELTAAFLNRRGIAFRSVNETPDGANINRNCGVGEIEGIVCYSSDLEEVPSVVKALREEGEAGRAAEKPAFAIVLDGDGDRGFVLYYDLPTRKVRVLDGDVCGYLLAEYKLRSGERSGTVVTTVESDIQVASALIEGLDLSSETVDVGDKWIGGYDRHPLLVGMESSGHVILPVAVPGAKDLLRAGNGLLTGLSVLAAIEARRFAGNFSIPYDRGFSAVRFTYFVDKSRFQRDSPLWKQDVEEVRKELFNWSQGKGAALRIAEETKEDPHTLYWVVYDGMAPAAVLFSRNSGTENKNAVYLKCRKDWAGELLPFLESWTERHRKKMKQEKAPEYRLERAILQNLQAGALSLSQLCGYLQGEAEATAGRIDAVLYGLRKEGRIELVGNAYRLVDAEKEAQ